VAVLKGRGLSDGLVRRGFPASDIDRIMGGNVYRLYKDVVG
jgi:microsomal dipeptidase-like Zn-dependent dipeptidase